LEHNLDISIGVDNDNILNYEEDKFDESDNSYLSVEEEDGKDYVWKGEAPKK
jgi:hypothetical protein